jgi:hypothetical protein
MNASLNLLDILMIRNISVSLSRQLAMMLGDIDSAFVEMTTHLGTCVTCSVLSRLFVRSLVKGDRCAEADQKTARDARCPQGVGAHDRHGPAENEC